MAEFRLEQKREAPDTVYLFRFREFAKPWEAGDGWVAGIAGPIRDGESQESPWSPFDEWDSMTPRPKFLRGLDGILLIRQEISQSSVSSYWQQREQRIGLGLQRSRLGHLLKAWGGFFRFQLIGHARSTG